MKKSLVICLLICLSFICKAATINTQPAAATVWTGQRAGFSISATSAGAGQLSYQWQVQLAPSTAFHDISDGPLYRGALSKDLIISDVTNIMNGYVYRCKVTEGNDVLVSNPVNLTVENVNQGVVTFRRERAGVNVPFAIQPIPNCAYQWEESKDEGKTWLKLVDDENYVGSTTKALRVNTVTKDYDGRMYHCVLSGPDWNNSFTTDNTVLYVGTKIKIPPAAMSASVGDYTAPGKIPPSFRVVTTDAANETYQWQVNSGGGYVDIESSNILYSGANSHTLSVLQVQCQMTDNKYRCVIWRGGIVQETTLPVALHVEGCIAVSRFSLTAAAYASVAGMKDDNSANLTQTYLRCNIPLNSAKKFGISGERQTTFKDRSIWFRNLFLQITYSTNADNVLSFSNPIDPTDNNRYVNRLDLLKSANWNFNFMLPTYTYIFSNKSTGPKSKGHHRYQSGDFAHLYFEPMVSLLATTVESKTPTVENPDSQSVFRVYSLQCAPLNVTVGLKTLEFAGNPLKIEMSGKLYWIVPMTSSVNYEMNFQSSNVINYGPTSTKGLTARQQPYVNFDALVMYYLSPNVAQSSIVYIHFSQHANIVTSSSEHYHNNFFQLQLGYSVNIEGLLSKLKNTDDQTVTANKN